MSNKTEINARLKNSKIRISQSGEGSKKVVVNIPKNGRVTINTDSAITKLKVRGRIKIRRG